MTILAENGEGISAPRSLPKACGGTANHRGIIPLLHKPNNQILAKEG